MAAGCAMPLHGERRMLKNSFAHNIDLHVNYLQDTIQPTIDGRNNQRYLR
jgi:hypothetical protein